MRATDGREIAAISARGGIGAGVSALRGVSGGQGDHAPDGDRLLALRRRVAIGGLHLARS